MNEYMKKYREQMNKVTLSEDADQAILDDLLKADSRKGVTYMKWAKRNISAAIAAIIITMASVTAVASVAATIIRSHKAESQVEGIGAKVNLGESYYYALLAGDSGEIYALTSNNYDSALTNRPVIVWKSTDQGDTWEEILSQPNELNVDSPVIDDIKMRDPSPFAGDLRMGETGVEAIVIMGEGQDDEQTSRVYQISADSCVEYDMDEVYTLLGGALNLFDVKYVNDHIIALEGSGKCLLYDTNTQKVVKDLPCDSSMMCLKTQDQFLIYGKEIYSCLDAETLEELEPEEGLQEFVQTMLEKNNNMVLPPMTAWNDTIVCATPRGIYEYRAGEFTQIRQLSAIVSDGRSFFAGLLPICKVQDGEYYICAWENATGMALWQIDGEKEEMK